MKRTVHLALWLTESDPIVFVGLSAASCRQQVVDFIAGAVADSARNDDPIVARLAEYDRGRRNDDFAALTEAFEPWWCGRFQFTTHTTQEVR